MFSLPIGQDPEFAVEPVSETGPAGGSETVDIVEVDSDDDNDYLEDDPSPSMKDFKLCAYFNFAYFLFSRKILARNLAMKDFKLCAYFHLITFYFHEKCWLEIWLELKI